MPDPGQFIRNLSVETGEILRELYAQGRGGARYKADQTLLTEADLAADRHITAAIRSAFPDDHILSEEHETSYPADGRPTWIVDPLDGTTNFSQGLHHWGVSICRVVAGFPQHAALAFPLIGEVFTAQAGSGATLNGSRLVVPPAESHPVSFFLADSRLNRRYTADLPYKPRILGSAAYNFCGIAKGIAVIGFESIPKIWDIAGSWLVLKEAGGAMQGLESEIFPLIPATDYRKRSYPVAGAADEMLLASALAAIKRISNRT